MSTPDRIKSIKRPYNIYHNLGYWFLLLIVLVAAGFYKTYFINFFKPKATLVHAHFTLMAAWVLMLITQPFLIKYKKIRWHRLLGKISYVLVPLTLLSSYFMMRHTYKNYVGGLASEKIQGVAKYSSDQLLMEGGYFSALPFFYLLWMAIFYTLAIIHRKRSNIHARYMLATALTLLGPTVDRILIILFDIVEFFGAIPVETASYFIADVVLTTLLIKDIREKKNPKPLLTSLIIFIAGQILYFSLYRSKPWGMMMSAILS